MPSDAIDDAVARDAAIPDLDWATIPDGVAATRFDAPSGSLALIEAGEPDQPLVLLVPGVTGSKEDFILMMPLLAGAGFHVVSYDMAGQYESHEAGPERLLPPRKHYDHDLFVADMLAILDAYGAPAHVLGYSFAGSVAQIALNKRPELFLSLTLLSSPPQSGQGFRGVKRIGWFSGAVSAHRGAAFMIWGLHRNVTHVQPLRQKFVLDRLKLTRRTSVDDIIWLMKHKPNLDYELSAASIPKLVAVGEHDLWPTSIHREFADAIGARIVVYATGHSPCETAPNQLVRDMLELFAEAK